MTKSESANGFGWMRLHEEQETREKVLVTLGGGGHLYEALCIARRLDEHFDLFFITSRSCETPKETFVAAEQCFKIRDIARIADGDNLLKKSFNTVWATFEAVRILRRVRPRAVIGVGTALSVPILLAARLLRIRSIFIESVTRVTTPTQTGRVIVRLRLASRFYVQWPEGEAMVPGAVFKGRVI